MSVEKPPPNKEPQVQSNSVNAGLLDDSWDAWDVVGSPSSSQNSLPPSSQKEHAASSEDELPVVQGSAEVLDGVGLVEPPSVDDLLADFLTPDDDIPSVTGTFTPLSNPALPTSMTSGAWRKPGIKTPSSGSHSLLDAAIPSGLHALEQARSSDEWQVPGSGSFDTTRISSTTSSAEWTTENLGGSSIAKAAQKRRKERLEKRQMIKSDEASVGKKVLFRIAVRVIVLAGLFYLIYIAYLNGR